MKKGTLTRKSHLLLQIEEGTLERSTVPTARKLAIQMQNAGIKTKAAVKKVPPQMIQEAPDGPENPEGQDPETEGQSQE